MHGMLFDTDAFSSCLDRKESNMGQLVSPECSVCGAEIINVEDYPGCSKPECPFPAITQDDPINPNHYKVVPRLVSEVADVLELFNLTRDHYLATAVTYILRAGKKDIDAFNEDLDKAIWYIKRRQLQDMHDDIKTEDKSE